MIYVSTFRDTVYVRKISGIHQDEGGTWIAHSDPVRDDKITLPDTYSLGYDDSEYNFTSSTERSLLSEITQQTIKALMKIFEMKTADMAKKCHVSRYTVYGWAQRDARHPIRHGR